MTPKNIIRPQQMMKRTALLLFCMYDYSKRETTVIFAETLFLLRWLKYKWLVLNYLIAKTDVNSELYFYNLVNILLEFVTSHMVPCFKLTAIFSVTFVKITDCGAILYD